MSGLAPVPEGFEFDDELLEAFAVRAFQDADPDMLRELQRGRLVWFGHITDEGIAAIAVADRNTWTTLGVVTADWWLVGKVPLENGSQ